jgi:cyclopropane-fatty-acyl-phospholipid synthase
MSRNETISRRAPTGGTELDRVPGSLARTARRAFLKQLGEITRGQILIIDGEGRTLCGRDDRLQAQVTVHDESAYLDIALGGPLGASEAFMEGKWSTPDLTPVVQVFAGNRQMMVAVDGGMTRLLRPLLRFGHWLRRNTRSGSRKNIHAHYDLGNEFFELFLDPTMMYSAAVYDSPDTPLEQASIAKLDLICRKLQLSEQDHLLEIGSGWGGMAMHAAEHYGCRVTTTTISDNQHAMATARIAEAGLADRVTVLKDDYRDLEGQFDKLVSIEMIEAVGAQFMDTFYRTCSDRLKPGGRALIQAITIADRNYQHHLKTVDFIKKYIFPGGALPSVGSMMDSVARATDLQLVHLQDIGIDYAHTLKAWRESFFDRIDDVRKLGYPEEFIRMWHYYLCYCEGGFLERAISDVQLVFDKPDARLAAPA